MRDDGRDRVVIHVGRGLRIDQDVARVEDVEALVLHRAEVEIGDGDDVERVEVIFAAVDLLVPLHRRLERFHGVAGARNVALAHPDAELDRPAGAGDEAVAVAGEIAGDEREQVGGLGERVVPFGEVPLIGKIAAALVIAVRKQDRKACLVGGHPHPVAGQHVGPVGEGRDPPETLGLALRAEDSPRFVEAHQLGVGPGVDFADRLDGVTIAVLTNQSRADPGLIVRALLAVAAPRPPLTAPSTPAAPTPPCVSCRVR